jgi:hypothetical membrane protein
MAARAANWVAIAAALIALLLLALLHVVSPEFDPSWRMISEYANGKHGWILSLMFAFWGVSQLALLLGIWRQQGKARFTIGLIFLFLSGAGTVMASVFDVNNPLHDLVSYFGILGLPVAAMLITGALGRSPGWSQAKTPLLWSANSTWIAVVLFAASFGVMALTFHSAGIVMDPQAGPTAHAPAGVIGVVGVTDRLTVAVNYLWVAAVAWQAIRLSREETR